MTRFEHGGKAYVQVNGKDYYLLHGYRQAQYGRAWLFLQVVGQTPLTPADLPEKYKLRHTRTAIGRISTVYDPASFAYRLTDPIERAPNPNREVEAQEPAERERQLLFVGLSAEAALALAVGFLAAWCDLTPSERQRRQASEALAGGSFLSWLENEGNLKTKAVLLELGGWRIKPEMVKQWFR